MLRRLEEISMGLVEKYMEIEKAHEDVCEQLHNKINELELKRRTKKFVVKYAVKVEVHC